MARRRREGSSPGMRADARRNYEKLLAEARIAFGEQGVSASLDDIARRAGVGAGTLYRHFPSRDALVEVMVRESLNSLSERGRNLISSETGSGDALMVWVRGAITHASTYRGLASSLMSSMYDEGSELYASCNTMKATAAELLMKAQDAGEVRSDTDAADLFALITAVAWASEQMPDEPDRTEKLLSVMTEGLIL